MTITAVPAGLFWRIWTANTTSAFGTAVTLVALPLVAVLVLDASTLEVGFVAAATVAAWLLFGLPAGVLVQRLPLRAALVGADLVRAAALLSIPVATAFEVLTLAHVVVVAFVLGLASVVFDVAFATYLPAVVSKDQLTARNSVMQGSESLAQVTGPALGGGLVDLLGAAMSLVADVLSYLVSAALLLTVPTPPAPAPPASTGLVTLVREGVRYVRHHPVVGPFALAATAINFCFAAIETLTPVFLIRTMDAAAATVGLLVACVGFGGIIGAAITTPLVARLGNARTAVLVLIAGPLAAVLLPLSWPDAGLLLFAAGSVGVGITNVSFSIIARTHRQVTTPDQLLPRVMATVRFISWGVLPLGALTAGVLGETLGTRTALWISCALMVLAPLPVLISPVGRHRTLLSAYPARSSRP